MIKISKVEFDKIEKELELLRNSSLYKRLLEFEQKISHGNRFTRDDLGF